MQKYNKEHLKHKIQIYNVLLKLLSFIVVVTSIMVFVSIWMLIPLFLCLCSICICVKHQEYYTFEYSLKYK